MRFIQTLKSRNGRPIDFVELEGQARVLAKDFNLSLIYVYGSYATGRPSNLSDIDVAFCAYTALGWEEYSDLLERMQQALEEEAIDLVDLQRVPLTLIHRILKTGRCIYAKSLSERIEFEVRKEALYLDTSPLRRDYEQALIRRIANGSYGYR